MKYVMAAVLLLGAVVMASDISGRWSGEFKVEGGDHSIPQFFILKQKDKTVTGTGGPDAGEQYPIENGRLQGDTLKFELTTGEWKFAYELKMASQRELRGDLKLESVNDRRSARVVLRSMKDQ
ncbi:MAG: hypothetical protein ACJ72H_31135 [Candidatus Sulfotelmatobacter sp.]